MGRKIPGAKHHGVKDPLKQQAQRLKSLKSKINAPPSHPDDQPIPKSLTRLFEYKDQQEQRQKAKKNKTRVPTKLLDAEERSANPMQALARLPGESGRSFTLRINNTLHSITRGRQQASEMERSQNPDNYLPEEDAKEERFDYIQRKKLKRKMKEEKRQRESGEQAPAKLSRMQRWTLKKKEKKAKEVEERVESSEPRYERVQFGETVHAPPALLVRPRRAQTDGGAPRPGRRDLLLSKLLSDGKAAPAAKTGGGGTAVRGAVAGEGAAAADRKARRRTLPIGVRMRLEQSQQEAIDAYRALKAQHVKNKK